MAGHSQFANIKHRKDAKDSKRAKIFTKLTREITVAARSGQADPNFNPRLRNAIISARKAGVPKDRIETAVKKGSGELQGENYEEARYEGYGPGGVAIIVEALTDNRNRTASDVRSCFTKFGGNLGETGSVGFMFAQVGIIEYPAQIASPDAVFEAAVEVGADNVESGDIAHIITCNTDDFAAVRDMLAQKYGDPETARLGFIYKIPASVSHQEQAQSILKLVDALEDLDDVQYVTGNYEIAEEIVKSL